MEELSLTSTWSNFDIDFTFSCRKNEKTAVSTIDHFFVSGEDSVGEAGVIHHLENTSDHEPIYCIMNIKTKVVAESVGEKTSKPSWKKVSIEEKALFQFLLED